MGPAEHHGPAGQHLVAAKDPMVRPVPQHSLFVNPDVNAGAAPNPFE